MSYIHHKLLLLLLLQIGTSLCGNLPNSLHLYVSRDSFTIFNNVSKSFDQSSWVVCLYRPERLNGNKHHHVLKFWKIIEYYGVASKNFRYKNCKSTENIWRYKKCTMLALGTSATPLKRSSRLAEKSFMESLQKLVIDIPARCMEVIKRSCMAIDWKWCFLVRLSLHTLLVTL